MPRSPRRLLVLALGLLVLAVAPVDAQPTGGDPIFTQGLQWGLERIGAPEAWATATGAGITIAVVDSGIDLAHQDLRGQLAGHISCIGANGDPKACRGSGQDDNGHGTHVSGIALAATGNGVGVAGVAPDARLLAVRALSNECGASGCTASGTAGDVSAGIRWAVDNGADVINLSLGGGALQTALGCGFCDAIEYAWSNGVIAVIAAGNDSILPAGFGDEPAVIVTATTRDDGRASYSNSSSGLLRSARWPVAAPGGEGEADPRDCGTGGQPRGVLSTYWIEDSRDEYACLAGTSMAAPHVSGALAVLRSSGLDPQGAIDQLLGTAVDLGPTGRDNTFGHGRVDLARAVGPAPPTTTTAPPTTAPTTTTAPPVTTATTAPPPPETTPSTETPPATDEPISTPDVSEAAPYTPAPADTEDAPGWLVAVAAAAVLASATGTAATARHLRRTS